MGRHINRNRLNRWIPVLVAALILPATLVGCGDDESPTGCRVRIRTSEEDGPVDVPLFLEGRSGRYRLDPVEGGEDGEMFAAGAPDGPYLIIADSGWGMLWAASRLPALSIKETTPLDIPMGRAGTLYIGASDRDRGRVGVVWAVQRADGDHSAVAVEVIPAPAFYEMTLVRVPAAEYHGRLRVGGRMADGTLVHPQEMLVESPELPRLVLVDTAQIVAIAVRVVGLNGPPREPSPVAVELLDAPMGDRYEQMSEGGVAGFPAVADIDRSIRVHLTGGRPAWSFDVSAEDVNRLGVFYASQPPQGASDLDPVRIAGDRAGEIDLVQVHGVDGEAYGRVHLSRDDADTWVSAEPGRQHWLVRAGADWASIDVDIPRGGGSQTVEVGGFEAGVKAQGRVIDLARGEDVTVGHGHRLLFFRVEGERLFLGEELDVAVSPQGHYDARIPPGTYDVRVMRPHGVLGASARVTLRPGVTLSRNFEIGAE